MVFTGGSVTNPRADFRHLNGCQWEGQLTDEYLYYC